MALFKRGNTWWIDILHNGQRLRQTTGTSEKLEAQRLHDKIKADLWNKVHFNTEPQKYWIDAVLRFLEESAHKRSLADDKFHLKWIDPFLRDYKLDEIDRDVIEHIAKAKEKTGVKPATVNRMLEVLRTILRRAANEWGWITQAPFIRMRVEDTRRVRWLTRAEAQRLLDELPTHLADMVEFSLATGLREANVVGLQWKEVDIERSHAWIHPDQAKANKAISVPLNSVAMEVLHRQQGKHPTFVFSYKGKPVSRANNHAWRKALKRAGIENFRWHDLRHTWASWHVQSGTSLQELQALGGWANFAMVLRYAHLSGEHLRGAAERIYDTKLPQ